MCAVTCSPPASVQVAPISSPDSMSAVTVGGLSWAGVRVLEVEDRSTRLALSLHTHRWCWAPSTGSCLTRAALLLLHLVMWFSRARCHQGAAIMSPGAPLVCPLGASHLLTRAELQQTEDTSPGRKAAAAPRPLAPHSSVSSSPLPVSPCCGWAHNVPGHSKHTN